MKEIKYVSTRGYGKSMDFKATVLMGQAENGGLIVPENLPTFSAKELAVMIGQPFYHVAFLVLRKLAPDIFGSDLWNMVRSVFNQYVFKNVSDGDYQNDIVPVRDMGNDRYLVRLSNGPTLAFKDFGLQMLGCLFEYLLQGRTMNILGATSGDTGTAAIYAMLERKGISVFMLSPLTGMSPFQAGHMRGVDDPDIHNIAIQGSFDDGQRMVKAIFNDTEFKAAYQLGAINSINWARIAVQVIYYVWAYLKVQGSSGNPVDVSVPTGNFGNIFAGYVAKKMGIPIRRLILATNENDVLHQFCTMGVYTPREKTLVTTSPSMDITAASNFERYIYYLFGGDVQKVRELWSELGETGSIDLSKHMYAIRVTNIVSESATEAQCHNAISHTYDSTGIVIDPHTAVAMHASYVLNKNDGVPMLVLETAQPCKFDDTIVKVLGMPAPRPEKFVGVEDRIQKYTILPPDNPELVKLFIIENAL